MIVQTASPSDADAIARIHVETWQAAYRGQLPQEFLDQLHVGQRAETWAAILNSPGNTLLAMTNEESVGFCHLCQSRDKGANEFTAEITSLYVLPANWRSGVGRALCSQALHLAESAGFEDVTLWVLDTNEPARAFYEAMGFELEGEFKIEERPGFQMKELRYRHPLD